MSKSQPMKAVSMIDVVVVAHTSARILEVTIQSITAQTSCPSMVIVDISPLSDARVADSTLNAIIGMPGCQYMASPGTNRFEAINQGIAACTSEYVMVLH